MWEGGGGEGTCGKRGKTTQLGENLSGKRGKTTLLGENLSGKRAPAPKTQYTKKKRHRTETAGRVDLLGLGQRGPATWCFHLALTGLVSARWKLGE